MGEHSTIALIINFALTFRHNHRLYPHSQRDDGNSYSDTFSVISVRAHVDIAHANSIDGPTTIHRMPDWSLQETGEPQPQLCEGLAAPYE